MQKNWALGLTLALTTAVMWGLLPIALKGLLGSMDVLTITWYRFSVSAALGFAWYGHRNKRSLIRLFSTSALPLTLLAIAGMLSNYALYLVGLNYTTASAAQIIIQLAPLLLLLGSVVIFKESFSRVQWLGVIAFCLGLLLFFHHRLESISNTSRTYLTGTLCLIVASITWAAYGMAQKQLIKEQSSNSVLLLIYIAGTLVFLPVATPSQIFALSPTECGLLAFASLNTIIAYNAFGMAMTYWDTSRVSATLTLAPLLTLVFVQLLSIWQPDYMALEPLDSLSWAGAIMLIIGSGIAALAKSSQRA
jgi:drug/metabolite transporter (DMT)-like permease